MKAASVLRAAWDAGIDIQVEGKRLLLDAASPPPRQVVDDLALHKVDILNLLVKQPSGWSKADWLKFSTDRAEVAQVRDGWDFERAGLIAFETCVERWQIVNPPAQSSADHCPHCGSAIEATDFVVPLAHGGEEVGQLHTSCAEGWRRNRIWQARRAMMWLIHPQDVRTEYPKAENPETARSIV